jgi:hypothetical protein
MIDTMLLPVTVVGQGGSLTVEILDDSFRPVIKGDTLQHLTCSGAPAELEVQVPTSVSFSFAWNSDSTGNILSGENTLQPKVDQTGTYTLQVINGQNGCASSLAIEVAA